MNASAVIAAAGLSSRMGAFKPLMMLEGKTIISRTAECLLNAGVEEVIVVAGFRGEELEAHLRSIRVRVIRNMRYRETDMLESLKIGLAALKSPGDRVFVLPGDVPLIRPETIQRLAAVPGPAACPVFDGVPGHPLMLSSAWIGPVIQYQGGGGLRRAVQALGIHVEDLPVNDHGCVQDADTLEDVRRLKELI